MLVSLFLSCCGFQDKIEPSWRNHLTWTADRGGEHNMPNKQNTFIIFLSIITVMQVIFWTEDNFYFIPGCRNSLNSKLKKLINEQILFIYSPSNVLCSSDESIQIKILSIILWLVCVPFALGSICKYWISVNKDTSSLKQVTQMCKCALL